MTFKHGDLVELKTGERGYFSHYVTTNRVALNVGYAQIQINLDQIKLITEFKG